MRWIPGSSSICGSATVPDSKGSDGLREESHFGTSRESFVQKEPIFFIAARRDHCLVWNHGRLAPSDSVHLHGSIDILWHWLGVFCHCDLEQIPTRAASVQGIPSARDKGVSQKDFYGAEYSEHAHHFPHHPSQRCHIHADTLVAHFPKKNHFHFLGKHWKRANDEIDDLNPTLHQYLSSNNAKTQFHLHVVSSHERFGACSRDGDRIECRMVICNADYGSA